MSTRLWPVLQTTCVLSQFFFHARFLAMMQHKSRKQPSAMCLVALLSFNCSWVCKGGNRKMVNSYRCCSGHYKLPIEYIVACTFFIRHLERLCIYVSARHKRAEKTFGQLTRVHIQIDTQQVISKQQKSLLRSCEGVALFDCCTSPRSAQCILLLGLRFTQEVAMHHAHTQEAVILFLAAISRLHHPCQGIVKKVSCKVTTKFQILGHRIL